MFNFESDKKEAGTVEFNTKKNGLEMNGQRRPVIEDGEQRQNVNVFLMICELTSSVASSKTERNSSSISAFINDPSPAPTWVKRVSDDDDNL